MRARSIKPGFFKNEHLVELPFEYRLLFQGLWMMADACGRLQDRPKLIKMTIFPADDIDIEAGLKKLEESSGNFIIRYNVNGENFIQIRNFEKHQNPHIKEKQKGSDFPEVPLSVSDEPGTNTVPVPGQSGGILNPDILNPVSVESGALHQNTPPEFEMSVAIAENCAMASARNNNCSWVPVYLRNAYTVNLPNSLTPDQLHECWSAACEYWDKGKGYVISVFKSKQEGFHDKPKPPKQQSQPQQEEKSSYQLADEKLAQMMQFAQWRNRWTESEIINTADLVKLGSGTVQHVRQGVLGLNEWIPIEPEASS